jgi:hypothetical protein
MELLAETLSLGHIRFDLVPQLGLPLGRLLQEPGAAANGQCEQSHRRGHQRGRRRTALGPPPGAFEWPHRARHNRFVTSETVKILGEARGARVALLTVLSQALEANGFRVARHRGI